MSAIFKSAIAASVLSIAVLASSGDAEAWGGRYYYDDPYVIDYYPIAPYDVEYIYLEPEPVTGYDGRPSPWTPEWYDYCAWKYRSFDPASGTFQPYRGGRRLCL